MMSTLTTLEFAALVMAVEFGLAALVGPLLLLRTGRRQVASAQHAAAAGTEAMLQDVAAKEPLRREALAIIFESTYQLEGEELAGKVEEFIAREQAFYHVMSSVYLDGDSSRLKEIPEELTKVISPWIRMTPKNMVDAASVDALEEANQTLNEELNETRRSMDELMAEYLAAFHKAQKLAGEQVAEDPEREAETDTDTAVSEGPEPDDAVAAEALKETEEAEAANEDAEDEAQADVEDAAQRESAAEESDAPEEAAEPVSSAPDAASADSAAAARAVDGGNGRKPIDVSVDVDPEPDPAASATGRGFTQDDLDKLFEEELGEIERA